MCVELDYRGGAAQGLASGVNEPHDEARRTETTTHLPSSSIPASQHTHTVQTHMFSPDTHHVHLPQQTQG